MTHIGFDADQDCSRVAPLAVRRGASFCCRYLKNISPREAQALSSAGLLIVSISERTAERALGGASAGFSDAARDLVIARSLGQPAGSAICASADFDVTPAQEREVLAYLTAYKAGITGMRLMVYGNGALCQSSLNQKIADFTWVAGAKGWRGTKDFIASSKGTLIQDFGDHHRLALGISIDSDTALVDNFGGWRHEPL